MKSSAMERILKVVRRSEKISLTWKTRFFVPNGFKAFLVQIQLLQPAFLCWLMPLFMAVLTSTRYIKELIFFGFLSFEFFYKRGGAGAIQAGGGWIKPEGTWRERE
jgi:hypothetical protein